LEGVASILFKKRRKETTMTMLYRFLLCVGLATIGTALALPVAAQFTKDQVAAGHQEPDKNKATAASGDTQPVAAFSENTNNNPSGSSTSTKDKKKDKNKAKPSPSNQEEEFNRVLQGIYG
jgi:hypothetical protein